MAKKFLSDIELDAGLVDVNGNTGTSGQILSSTGTGVSWVSNVSISEASESVHITVKNTSGATITKGTPVYVTGETGNSGKIEVAPADASDDAKMPALGLLESNLADNAEGFCVQGGLLEGLSTDTIDGTSTTANDTVYIKAGGGLTMTKPTGTNFIQNIAKVARVHASNGSLVVSSILRTNDVPTPLYIDHANQRVGIGATLPTYPLHVSSSESSGDLLFLHNSNNASGAAIRFSDHATSTSQNGTITYRHSDSQSQGGGASFHFIAEPDTALVLGDSTNKGRFVSYSQNSTDEVDYGFGGNVNTGMYSPSSNQVGLVASGSRKLLVNTDGVTIQNGRLYLGGTVDTNTSSTTALVLNGTEVEKRTLGSAAFSNTGDYVAVTGDTMSGDLDVNARIRGDYFTQEAHGKPSSNLGSPTITEMALFDSQFTPKTTLASSYNDLTDLTFWKQDTSSSTWEEITTYSDDQKRKFLRTSNSSVIIPNNAYKFRVEFKAKDYTFANALYGYWSSNSHNMQVHIWKYNFANDAWTQHTSATNTVSSWPGHLYLPFSTIPWHETAETSTGHYRYIRIEFTPTWVPYSGSGPDYSSNNINIYGLEIWGGYPSGRRTPHYYDQNGKLNTWGDFQVSGNAYAPIVYDSNNTSYYLDPASTSELNVLNLAGDLSVGPKNNATVQVSESGGATVKMLAGSIGRVGTYSNHNFIITQNSGDALTIDTSKNATFAGDLTVSGGDIVLEGTGRIQGIDTVSAGTDAANKTYVDNAVAGVAYTHPTHPGDDFSVDTGALTGAVVVSDIDINVTTDTLGHVTDANGTVSTRTLTLADLGYTGDTNANNYTHPTHPGDDINLDTGALTGATVISDLDFNITTDTLGHVTDANATYSTRNLTASDIGAAASSHNHDSLYVNVTGDTMTGALTASGGINGLTLSNGISGSNFNITGVNQITINDPGEGILFGGGANNVTLYAIDDSTDNKMNFGGASELQVDGSKVFHDGYHPNADKWTTARTITLAGELSGAVSIDGSSNATLTASLDAAVVKRRGTITSEDWNTFIDGTEAGWYQVNNMTGSNKPPAYTYGTELNFSTASANKLQIYAPDNGTDGNGIWIRTGWNAGYDTWREIPLYGMAPYSGGDLRASIFYDSNDTNYYLDPASTGTSLNVRGVIQNPSVWINDGDNYNNYNENIRLFNASNGVSVIAFSATGTEGIPTTSILGYSDRLETRVGSTWRTRLYAGYFVVNGDARATIFYDSNDTNYYLNPASTSELNVLNLAGDLSVGGGDIVLSGTGRIQGIDTVSAGTDAANKTYVDNAVAGVSYTHPTHPGDDINLDTGALTGATVISDLDFNITTDTLGHVTDANATYSTRNLTASDLGIASTELVKNYQNVNYVASDPTSSGSRTNYGVGVTVYEGYSGGSNRPHTYDATVQFMPTSGQGFELSASWISTTTTPLKIRSLRDCCNGWSPWVDVAVSGTTSSGTFSTTGDYRAPIFYDSDNTAYYLNPASTGTSATFAGNVGIGTTNPQTGLHLSSTTDNRTVGGTDSSIIRLTNTYGSNFGAGGELQFGVSETAAGRETLSVIKGAYTAYSSGNYGGDLEFYTRDADGLGLQQRMTITADGKVGIGATSPSEKLDVAGSIKSTETIWTGYDSGVTNSVSCSNWFRSSGDTGWYNATHAGGIYMTDGTWVRVYNNKKFYNQNNIESGSSMHAPIFYDRVNTGYFFNGDAAKDGVDLVTGGNYAINVLGTISGGHRKHGNLETPEMQWSVGGSTDLNWKKLCDVVISDASYSGWGAEIEITNFSGNFGNATYNGGELFKGALSIYHWGGTGDTTETAYANIPYEMRNYVRWMKINETGQNRYELQVKSPGNYQQLYVKVKPGIGNQVVDIISYANDTNGSTSGTAYASTQTADFNHEFAGGIWTNDSRAIGWKNAYGNPSFSNYYGAITTSASLYLGGNTSTQDLFCDEVRSNSVLDKSNTAYYFDGANTGDSIRVAGDVVAYYSSDERLKDNINPIENALEKVNAISGVTFEWNEKSHKTTGKKDVGVVAQEIEAVLPELVETRTNGYKAVDYQKLTAVLIESVKELTAKVEALEAKQCNCK